jgi:uncharacterized Zn finger protein (UPF0148 family)
MGWDIWKKVEGGECADCGVSDTQLYEHDGRILCFACLLTSEVPQRHPAT